MIQQHEKAGDTEAEWVVRLKNGDEGAFRKIYDQYHHRLYQYTLKFTNASEMAKEIVQEVFVKLWMSHKYLNPELSLQSYLYTIARHLNFKFLQKVAHDSALKEEIIHCYTAQRNYIEDKLIYDEYVKIAHEAVEQLSPHRQLVYRMSKHEGLSHQEIAIRLGVSMNTVKNHLVDANKSIKEYLLLHTDIPINILIFLIAYCL